MDLFDLTGRVAVISGGSRGIGASIARAYAAAGASVVISSRKQENVEPVAEAINAEFPGRALAVAAHAGQPEAAVALVRSAVERFGRLDIVVNNAATNPHFGPFLSAEDSHWDKILDVNVKGYFRVAKACVPAMRARGGGGERLLPPPDAPTLVRAADEHCRLLGEAQAAGEVMTREEALAFVRGLTA